MLDTWLTFITGLHHCCLAISIVLGQIYDFTQFIHCIKISLSALFTITASFYDYSLLFPNHMSYHCEYKLTFYTVRRSARLNINSFFEHDTTHCVFTYIIKPTHYRKIFSYTLASILLDGKKLNKFPTYFIKHKIYLKMLLH